MILSVIAEESAVPDQALVNSDLQSALAEVRQAYVAANPKSFARHQEACEAMPGGNTRTTLHNAPFPLTVVRGEGCRRSQNRARRRGSRPRTP